MSTMANENSDTLSTHVLAVGEAFCAFPPTPDEWLDARTLFMGLSKAHGYGSRPLPEKFLVLERELERSYCSRNYIACILLSQAMIASLSEPLKKAERDHFWGSIIDYAIDDSQKKWLRDLRNDWSHDRRMTLPVDMLDYVHNKMALEEVARVASSMAFRVAFEFTRLP